MKPPEPTLTIDLFPGLLKALLDLLESLPADEWNRPTACPQWSVKDVALHLLGGDIGILSRKRDGYRGPYTAGTQEPITSWHDLVELIDHLNDLWIQAARRISPRLLCDLLQFSGEQVYEYFQSLDPYEPGDPVSWAGPEPAPAWLDIAREYTERWLHQQHIREATGRPGLTNPRYLTPVLETFVHALPHTYRDIDAEDGTTVGLTITGVAGGTWLLRREHNQWHLNVGDPTEAVAEVIIPQDLGWRLFTKGITPSEARAGVQIEGDETLGTKVLETVSIIA
jgi:uncharacterized protein (TIGR03083 family)